MSVDGGDRFFVPGARDGVKVRRYQGGWSIEVGIAASEDATARATATLRTPEDAHKLIHVLTTVVEAAERAREQTEAGDPAGEDR